MYIELGGVDNSGGQPAQSCQPLPLYPDSLGNTARFINGMTASGFRKTANKRLVGSIEKKNFNAVAKTPHFLKSAFMALQKFTSTNIGHQHNAFINIPRLLNQVDETSEQAHRQIIDTIEPLILQRSDRCGLARSRHTGNNDDPHDLFNLIAQRPHFQT